MVSPWRDEQTLYKLYVEKRLSTYEIADELGCSSSQTIRNWLERFGIERRARGGHSKDAPWKDAETLRKLHWDDGLSTSEMSDELGCSQPNISRWMRKLGVESRDISESLQGERNGFFGETHTEEYVKQKSEEMKEYLSDPENHPRWKGGISWDYGKSWTSELKESVRERDDRRCQNPVCQISESEIERKLDVHHIVPYRYFGQKRHREANDESNLVSLCRSCHAELDCMIYDIETRGDDLSYH